MQKTKNFFFNLHGNTINKLQFKKYALFHRLLLVRAEIDIGILISVNGFANNNLNNLRRYPFYCNILVIFSQSKNINCRLLQILIALSTNDLIRFILNLAGAKLSHLL